MINKIILIIYIYNTIYIIFSMLKIYNKISCITQIIMYFYYKLIKKKSKKIDKDIDMIYEMITETEPNDYDIKIIDDTEYMKKNEEKILYNEYFNK